jgi:hypothetical protein
MDNRFICVQASVSKQLKLFQQKIKLRQPPQVKQILRHFMHGSMHGSKHRLMHRLVKKCLTVIWQDYQEKSHTTFNYLKKLEISFEFNSFLIPHIIQVHCDGSDSRVSQLKNDK